MAGRGLVKMSNPIACPKARSKAAKVFLTDVYPVYS